MRFEECHPYWGGIFLWKDLRKLLLLKSNNESATKISNENKIPTIN
jgi:hypothetical protein